MIHIATYDIIVQYPAMGETFIVIDMYLILNEKPSDNLDQIALLEALGFPAFLLIVTSLSLLFVAHTGMQWDLDIQYCLMVMEVCHT